MIDSGNGLRKLEEEVVRLEPQIERLLHRFRIPPEDAQTMLDELLWALLAKSDQIRSPERWLVLTLRNRCLIYWRQRRQALYRAIDAGILSLLTSSEISDGEKERIRHQLTRWLRGVSRRHREVLSRRYGLTRGRLRVESWARNHGGGTGPDVLAAVAALVRRAMRRGAKRGRPPR